MTANKINLILFINISTTTRGVRRKLLRALFPIPQYAFGQIT